MLYHWLYHLSSSVAAFNVFKYITLRSFAAFVIAFLTALFWGRRFIAYMKERQFGQIVRTDGPQTHLKKAGTPTFGGVFILGSVFVAIAICGNFQSIPFLLAAFVGLSYAVLGWLDDYLKILKKNTDGVSAKKKLLWQFATALIVTFVMVHYNVIDTNVYVPFLKSPLVDLGYFYILFASIVIVGTSNAVNLTDGLDGLATGPISISAATLGLLAYLTGHSVIANYLFIPYVPHVGELLVLASAVLGAGMGFLWYNSYPAQIFMGDVGSLALGGILGTMAVLTKNEILFLVLGGIFVVEATSVILQVASYKLRKKRIFKMAPIHHHFELMGWPESKVIVRFWIISIVLALASIATLKLR